MNNHKGFSLIELVVTIAILSVVILGISLMLTSGSNLYSAITRSENARSNMQVALAQIQERAIDCDGVCLDGEDLLIARKAESAIYRVSFDAEEKTLNLSKSDLESGDVESGIICRNVNAFSASVEDGLLSASMSIRTLNETKYTALRNAVTADSSDALIAAVFPDLGGSVG